MTAYAEFAAFYDQIMGDRTPDIERVRRYVRRYHPHAATLLELGCGTGALLAGLSRELAVTGIDRCPQMLEVAARTVPGARLVRGDITDFALGSAFDVVICMFDTVNHLQRFGDWRAMFARAHEHLADGGLFVFDVNTTGRLRGLWQGPAFATESGANSVIMDVLPGGRPQDGEGELSMWTVRIFERVGDGMFRLHQEVIPELGVPLDVIRAGLAGRFDELEVTGLDGGPASDESSRAFFVLRRSGLASGG